MIDPLLLAVAAELPGDDEAQRLEVARVALAAVDEALLARQISAARFAVDYDALAKSLANAKTSGRHAHAAVKAVIVAHLEPHLQRARQHIEYVEQDRRRAVEELDRRAVPGWADVMAVVDRLYPADVFAGDSGDSGDPGDPGPRVLALLREIDRLKALLVQADREVTP